MLHRGRGGDFPVRWIINMMMGLILVAAFWGSLATAASCLLNEENWSGPSTPVCIRPRFGSWPLISPSYGSSAILTFASAAKAGRWNC